MALTERSTIDKIEVLENGVIQVRQSNIIERDGAQIAKTYHRWTLVPGQDVSDQEQKVKDIANAVWTTEVIQNYQASISVTPQVTEVIPPDNLSNINILLNNTGSTI